MDIILKEDDIKRLVGDALGLDIPPENMEIAQDSSDERVIITISSAEKYLVQAALPRKTQKGEDEETGEAIPQETLDLPSADSSPLTMEALKKASDNMALAGPSGATTPVRTLSNREHLENPPPTRNGREI
jgi:hypothetical protein